MTNSNENTFYNDCRDIDFNKIKLSGFVNSNQEAEVVARLNEIKKIVDEMLFIKDSCILPHHLKSRIANYSSQLQTFTNRAMEDSRGTPQEIVTTKTTLQNEIITYYDKAFSLRQSGELSLLQLYSIAKSFDNRRDNKPENEFNRFIERASDDLKSIENSKADISSTKNKVDLILTELEKKASKEAVSNYAAVFGDEAEKYKEFAKYWLGAGIAISLLFVVLMFLAAHYKFLPTEIFSDTGRFLRYDFTNLASKVIIIAVIVFVMSFAFKQYSVNRHLQTLSQHRQNALNSYKLLTASIVGDDIGSRNALMVQVAKAIYEHSQSTGFLGSEKGQNVNSGIVELTKIIGENRPS